MLRLEVMVFVRLPASQVASVTTTAWPTSGANACPISSGSHRVPISVLRMQRHAEVLLVHLRPDSRAPAGAHG